MKQIILFVLMVTLCVTMIIPHVYATQFIPYTGTTLPANPKICILDNTAGKSSVNNTQIVLNEWSNKLNYLTHSTAWNMKVFLIDRMHMTNCDVTFNFSLEPSDPIQYKDQITGKHHEGRYLGMTTCDTLYGHTYCQINIYLLNNNLHTMFTTTEHEFGHAMGLGHRQGDTTQDNIRAFLSDDLMYAMSKTFMHLTDDDVLAVIHLYGTHGFNSTVTIPSPYIIDHPTTLKEYCNGVSGKICFHHI